MNMAASHLQLLFGIAGKVAVVTGGGRGIGLMIAQTFVRQGAKVYITSRSAKTCEKVAEQLTEAGPGSCYALPEDLSSEQWDRVMALNVRTPFLLTRALRPSLLKGSNSSGGDPARIINIGSVTGLIPQSVPTYSYDVSKAAVHHLTRKLSAEFAPAITVNAIAPGYVPSRMSRGLLTGATTEAGVAAQIPMRRWGAEDDMGGAAVFLASRAGAWVTGQVLVVDGGQTAKPLALAPETAE